MTIAAITNASASEGDYGARIASRQERAFFDAARHTRRVKILRRALPVCAMLATGLYLVTSNLSVSFGPMDASVERIEVSRESLRMVNPKLQGFDKEKGAYKVTADYAEQSVETPELIRLHTIKAEMGNDEKGWSKLIAKGGAFDTKAETLVLEGDIRVSTSSGMSGLLERAAIDMKTQKLTSDKPVEFDLINGTVNAQTMEFLSSERKLFFRGNVKVHIRKRPENAPAENEKVVAQP